MAGVNVRNGRSTGRIRRIVLLGSVIALLTVSCSSESSSGPTTTSSSLPPSTTEGSTTTTSTSTIPPTTAPAVLEQPAIWPAVDVVFDDPEVAAADFVAAVLGVPIALGDFMAADSRSGEITVSCDLCNGTPRGRLLMRRLGPTNGWFVTAIVNDLTTIASPVQAGTVAAGPLEVAGTAIGFEANVSITAYVAGDETRVLDRVTVMAGMMGEPGPFSVTLDLSEASAGDLVMILVRGGVGLETDPGDLAAIAVVIG